ncbi:MAG: alpha/beta hydrolase family protein [Rhodococcus sp. (in: high G+C Gram-positive bacteria)]
MRRSALFAAGCMTAIAAFGAVPAATAQPVVPSPSAPGFPFSGLPSLSIPGLTPPVVPAPPATPRVSSVTMMTDRRAVMQVYSVAMNRDVQVQVLLPADRSVLRPSLYMLDGVTAGQETNYTESTWTQKTDAVAFFADKPINVVLPVGGRGSYYSDWEQPDPVLGLNKWETFLTSELPPLVDAQFEGNGVNSLMGLSMGAQAAMNLITKYPSLYTGVAGFSGCYDNRSTEAKNSVRVTVASTGGNATNMWGENSDPAWDVNDPSLRVNNLVGKEIYVSAGNGLPGPTESLSDLSGRIGDVLSGSALEAAANTCTARFADTLRAANLPATVVFKPYGTHAWRYWEEELHNSWPSVAKALGI